MCSDFLADINNNHAKECQMDWGPKFGSNIKAITALGQLLLVARLELDVSTLEILGSYESCGRPLTIREKVQTCSSLYQEAFAASQESLGKLFETSWELAHSRGSLHHVTQLFGKGNPAVSASAFRDEWHRVHEYLNNVGQHARACSESWTYLLSFIHEFETLINNMITDNTKLGIRLTKRLEDAEAEIETRRYDNNRGTLDKKDFTRFDFIYAIPLLITLLFILLLSGIFLNAIILSAMFLCALVFLKEGMEKSGYGAISDNDIEDQTRDLQIETEHLARKRKANTTKGQKLQEMGNALASAMGGVREIHKSYRVVFDRINSMNGERIDRFRRTMNKVSYIISWDESYPPDRTTNQRTQESKDVTELLELAVELRLTFYILFEWSLLHMRISQDIFTPALHKVQSFSSLATLISGIDLYSERLKLRPAQQRQSAPRQTEPLLALSSLPRSTIPTANPVESDIYFSQPPASMARERLTFENIAESAELAVNKLHREAQESAISSVQERVTEVYTTTMPTVVMEPKDRQSHLFKKERENLPALEAPNQKPIAVRHRLWRSRTRDKS